MPGSRFDSPATITALGRLQQWAKNGYFNDDYNAIKNDAAAQLFAKGKGAMWIGGDWDSTIIKAGLGAANVGVMPVPPGPRGQWTSIGGLSGPWHISAKTKHADLGAEWLNYVITSTKAKRLMFEPAAASRRQERAARPRATPYLRQVSQRVREGRERRRAPALHGLGLAVDVRDPEEPVPAPPRGAHDAAGDGEGRAGRLGEVRQDAPLSGAGAGWGS